MYLATMRSFYQIVPTYSNFAESLGGPVAIYLQLPNVSNEPAAFSFRLKLLRPLRLYKKPQFKRKSYWNFSVHMKSTSLYLYILHYLIELPLYRDCNST
jgi:hypothetical protein